MAFPSPPDVEPRQQPQPQPRLRRQSEDEPTATAQRPDTPTATTPDTPVLVAGATGFIGAALCERLGATQHPLRMLARHPDRAPHVPGATALGGDVRDRAAMRRALEGVHSLVYLVHSMTGPGGASFAQRDREGAEATLAAAEDAGVERIVYLGGLGRSDQELSPHLASRQEVARVLGGGKPALTHLRAAVIVGAGGASFEMIHQLVARLPVMVCPQWVGSRCQPIAKEDVVDALVACLDHPETAGMTYDLGGPDVLRYHDMMEVLGEEMGRTPFIIKVPVLTPNLSAYWVDLVTDAPPALAHALIEGLRNDVVVEGPTLDHLLPRPPMRYREAVRKALAERGR